MSLNLEQATSLIIERARQLVNHLIEQRGRETPPFLSEEFARLQGIKEIVKTDLGKEVSAVLLKLHDGDIIKVNANHHPVRQNFSCAHEIGHSLLRELRIELDTENIEYRTFNSEAPRRARAKARERLCNAAATELLMPESIFRKYLLDFGISINSVEQLANIFRVSVPAAAIRIAEVSPEPCVALLWRKLRNKSKALQLAWPRRKPIGKSHYTPVHKRVTPPSTLHKAYEYNSPVKCYKLFKVNNVVKNLPMESKGFGQGETRYIISLAFPGR